MLGADKAGHVGSLDPLATGMLPICLGEATKIAGDILSGRKLYRFTVALGTRTSTGDTEGGVVETAAVPDFDELRLDQVLGQFRGRQTQIPPMYSALKRDGQPLYKLARAGIEVERAARDIEIFSLTRQAWLATNPEPARRLELARYFELATHLELEVLCSKGTYVRTLAEDIAKALGTCGHVQALRRVYVEPFNDAPMDTLESIEEGILPTILPADAPLQHMVAIRLDSRATEKVLHGQAVTAGECGTAGRVRLYEAAGAFIGIGESDGAGSVRPKRLFNGAR
jgi:tRNA pseudouridine55 synthase